MAFMKNNSTAGHGILFSTRIKDLMDENGVSQAELSRVVEVTRQAIGSYVQGTTIPDIEKFAKIADYFDVTADYLLGRSDAKNAKNTEIVGALGLWDKSIEVIKNKLDEHPSEEDERTLRDIFNIMISAGGLPLLLKFIGNRTLPKSHWGAAGWEDLPMEPNFIESTSPNVKMVDAAYKQMAHDMLDDIINDVGKYSVQKWFYKRNLDERLK